MAWTPPPMPALPPRPLDMSRLDDRLAYWEYEAGREFTTWFTGDEYAPLSERERLRLRIRHGEVVTPPPASADGGWSLLMPPDIL